VTERARAAELALRASLIAAIAGLVGGLLLLRGVAGAWAFPEPATTLGGRALAAAALTAGLAFAGWGWERGHGRGGRRWMAALTAIGLIALLALLCWALAPRTYFGDWKTLTALIDRGGTIGKWYGAGLAYVGFHRGIGSAFGLIPTESAQWLSSVAGAVNAYLFFLFARQVGLTRAFRGWPLLFAATFGVVGLGLGHLEIYPVVATAIGGVLVAGAWLLEAPSSPRVVVFGLVSGLALATYLGAILLVPILLGVLTTVLARAVRERRSRLLAGVAAAGLLIFLPLVAGELWSASTLGPGPIEKWVEQFSGRDGQVAPEQVAGFLPEDVHSPHLRNVMRLRHALSAWHATEMVQQLALDQLVPLLIVAVFGARRLANWGRGRRGEPTRGVGVLLTAAAVIYLAWAWMVVPGLPNPIDWDLRAVSALPVLYLAGWLLARDPLPERGARLRLGLAAGAAVLAALCGVTFLGAAIERPDKLGPEAHGLRLGAVPERLVLSEDGYQHVWFWVENQGDRRFHIDTAWIGYELWAKNSRLFVQQPEQRRRTLGDRYLEPDVQQMLVDFSWEPRRFLIAQPEYTGLEPSWREADGLPPPGRYVARWHLSMWLPSAEQTVHLESQDVELVVEEVGE
jgi:hypothetical protein